jgi:two-component sensor histidine kinase
LSTLIFLSLKESLFLTILYVITTIFLLYLEHLNNPSNLLAHNFNALFNLAYTAIIIYVFGLLYHFNILRTFKELDDTNQQNVLLLKEVHHRVKNNLNMIASIVGLHSNTLEGKEQEEMLKTQNRIESIAIVHEMLYRHENFAQINFERYMKQLSKLLLSTYASNKQITINIKSNTQYLPLEIMVQLGIMVNEFITNSIKYAFPNNEGKINISLSHTEDGYLLIYQDNGIGHETPQALLKHKSLGIKLINLTAKQLKGSVETSSPGGLKFEVRF